MYSNGNVNVKFPFEQGQVGTSPVSSASYFGYPEAKSPFLVASKMVVGLVPKEQEHFLSLMTIPIDVGGCQPGNL